MNGFYSTFFCTLMITAVLLNQIREGYRGKLASIEGDDLFLVITLTLMLVGHLNQFFAVDLQLFTPARWRERSPTLMSLTQGCLIVIVPFFVIIIQLIWLSQSRGTHMWDTVYYKFIAADMLINVLAGWTYLNKLQRIQFE